LRFHAAKTPEEKSAVSSFIAAWLHHQSPEPARARSNNACRLCCPAWAEEERTRILRRANEGRIAAIKRGTKLGRRPKLDISSGKR
jgi:hypothetical protein